LGADFINKHLLYDPNFKQVKWRHEKEWDVSAIKATNETAIPKYSSRLMKIKLEAGAENSEQVIAEIFAQDEPYLLGGPGLIQVDDLGSSLVEVFNTGIEPLTIARGQVIGAAENVSGQSMTPFQADLVNSIVEKQWRESKGYAKGTISEEFRKLCKLEVPVKFEDDYRRLLAKHRQIFSLNKNDFGYCDTILHKLGSIYNLIVYLL